jgi:hypothetical protein
MKSEGKSMRTFFSRVVTFALAWSFLTTQQLSTAITAEVVPQAKDDKPAISPVDQLVHEALTAETNSNVDLRADKIKEALAAGQDSSAAHWLAGQVQVGSRWLSVDEAAKEAAQVGKVAEYRKQRDLRGNTLEDHIALARFCAKLGLTDQERGQLIMAFQLDPTNKEAFKKLGLVRQNGQIFTLAQFTAMRIAAVNSAANSIRWTPRLQQLRRRFETNPSERDDVLNAIRGIRQAEAIPSMEYVFGKADRQLAAGAVDALKAMSSQQSTESLLRFIIFSDDKSIRDAALEGLRYRSRDSYLPLIISALKAPVQVEFNVQMLIDGNLSQARCVEFQAGPVADQIVFRDTAPTPTLNTVGARRQQEVLAEVDHINAVNSTRNERLFGVLASITGEQHQEALQWWNWWFDEMEYQPIEKETLVTYRASCFVRGTPVWTSTGPMAIEKIKPGETVLSQDPQTGELAYKPVLATTYRPPSPVVEVKLGTSTVRGTRGHPYWVSGEGWRMAKELTAGQMLHTVNGPVRIESAQQTGEEECFNLIVADFNTYFVGDAKVLVHDNTLRGPNTIRVPGLQE